MANGGKRTRFNSRERAITTDHNRMQEQIAQARAAMLEQLYRINPTASQQYVHRVTSGGQMPMIADIYGGLFVRADHPDSLSIDSGVMGVINPEAAPTPDDWPYQIIEDPGVSLAGTLTFQSNAGAGPRWDVIIAEVEDRVEETSERDIIDPATKEFAPETVEKVTIRGLKYRIMRGTVNNGMPPITTAAVPLAIAIVQPGATGWHECTFYDVRPLVSDRAPFNVVDAHRRWYDFDFTMVPTFLGGTSYIRGEAWTEYKGRIVGGQLKKATPTPVADFGDGDIDFDAFSAVNGTDNLSMGGTMGAAPVFCLFPNDLPRWARYSENPIAGLNIRAPYGPRGILIGGRPALNDKLKIDDTGAATGVALPSSFGNGLTADGVMLFMGAAVLTAGGVFPLSAVGYGRRVHFSTDQSSVMLGNQRLTTLGTGAGVVNFGINAARLSNSYLIPPNFRQLICAGAITTDAGGVAPPSSVYNGFTSIYRSLALNQSKYFTHSVTSTGSIEPSLWMPEAEIDFWNPPGNADDQTLRLELAPTSWRFGNGITQYLYLNGYTL